MRCCGCTAISESPNPLQMLLHACRRVLDHQTRYSWSDGIPLSSREQVWHNPQCKGSKSLLRGVDDRQWCLMGKHPRQLLAWAAYLWKSPCQQSPCQQFTLVLKFRTWRMIRSSRRADLNPPSHQPPSTPGIPPNPHWAGRALPGTAQNEEWWVV